MGINEAFIAELKNEAAKTRKILERVPVDKADWRPHPKSYALGRLATHIAEIPGWAAVTLDEDELDFAKIDYKPTELKSTGQLLKILDDNVAKAMKSLENAPDSRFFENWTLRTGDQIYFTLPKAAVLRSFAYSHWIHHRAQLSVYLRLLDIPVPGMYGPTADEPM
jgi:uncharacterized damage-inducible protein DinB